VGARNGASPDPCDDRGGARIDLGAGKHPLSSRNSENAQPIRAGTLALRVRSIAAGAKLDVNDERFVPYRSRPGPAGRARAAPPMRQNERPATPMAEAAE
jgi:hypothetical protein